MKVMFDTQIYDLVIVELGMTQNLNKLSTEGKLKLLTTHIQRDEIEAISDVNKKQAILEIVTVPVTTSGAVYGVSVYGMATYGDGNAGGFGIDDIRSESKNHTEDALIAMTAVRDVDVLVTEDARLSNRLKTLKSKCQVWNFSQFKTHISRI